MIGEAVIGRIFNRIVVVSYHPNSQREYQECRVFIKHLATRMPKGTDRPFVL